MYPVIIDKAKAAATNMLKKNDFSASPYLNRCVVENFISYINNSTYFKLTDENVLGLLYLAITYHEVPLEVTLMIYIDKKHDQFIKNYLERYLDGPVDIVFEKIIGKYFEEYMGKKEVHSFPTESLLRILNVYLAENQITREIIEFLLLQLSGKGEEASLLFSVVNVSHYEDHLLNQLDMYRDVFNPCFLKKEHFFYMLDKIKDDFS